MLPRLLRVLYPSFSRAPRITTAPLRSKTWNALLSSARRYYPGHRGGRWVTVLDPSRIPSNQKKGRGVVVEATPLSENDYYSVVERCFDIVMDHAATAQEEGSSITLEHLVRSHLPKEGKFNPLCIQLCSGYSKLIVLFLFRMTC